MTAPYKIQAILFPKSLWGEKEAKLYLDRLGIRPIKLHIARNFYRFRIRKPDQYASYYTETHAHPKEYKIIKYK